MESQFAKYFEMAEKKQGITGENLLQIIESRLDNVVYRAGFATSRPEARILVTHGHFEINGKRVDIPSYLVKPGDVITLQEKSRSSEKFKAVADITASRNIPAWLDVNRETFACKVVTLASRDQIDLEIEEHLIVELYSK